MSTSSSGTSGKDNVFDLGSSAFASDHFRMHEFKVKRCPRARPHDWTQCPFAHPGEKARRRDPRRYRYSGTACPEFRKSGCCRRGDACPFAHGVFECWLHPSRYRTQLCTDGGSCKRRVCFFAHCESELRKPEDDPVSAERQVQAELAAGSGNHLTDALGHQNNNEHINFTKTSGLPESSIVNGGGGVTTANPFAQEVQVLQQQHLAQALQTVLNASGVANANGGNPSSNQSDVALELLKQITASQSTTSMATPDSSGGSNATTALVALVQQMMMQSGQPEQQQQQATKTKPASSEVADSTSLQDPGAEGPQASIQLALKQILQQSALPAATASETPAVSMAATPPPPQFLPGGTNGLGVDASQLAQLDPSVLNGLLEQNSAAKSRAPPSSDRHSIDNSFLAAKILGMSGHVDSDSMAQGGMMMPAQSQAQTQSIPNVFPQLQMPQPDARHMFSIGGMHTGHYLTNNLQNMAGTVHGIPLDQNPGLSSQLMQLDPAILNSLAMRARQAGTVNGTNPGVIDNSFLARLSNVDVSGIVNGVAAQPDNHGSHMIAPGVPVQNSNEMQAGFLQNIQNSLLASQMQGLLHGLGHTDTAMHFPQMNAMASFEKNTHHERMGSGNEASLMMPSNMLQ